MYTNTLYPLSGVSAHTLLSVPFNIFMCVYTCVDRCRVNGLKNNMVIQPLMHAIL